MKEAFLYFTFFIILKPILGIFSGFYHAKDSEDYGGAFLISKLRLLSSKPSLENAWYPEGIIFSIIHPNSDCRSSCKTIFTRDYFDFLSDHLSSTTNIIGTMNMQTQKNILNFFNLRLKNYLQHMKSLKHTTSTSSNNTIRNKIVGIIPFSQEVANPGSVDHSYLQLHQIIRQYFFQLTFYSLYYYFDQNIMVYVATDDDKKLLQSWNIPAKDILVMDSILAQVPKEKYFFRDPQRKDPRPRNQLLPKYSLLDAIDRLQSDPLWEDYRYVYYTEGDQILHLRKLKYLLRAIDSRNGYDVLIPHRMQTLPLYQNIPSSYSEGWNYQKLSNVNLITEPSLLEPIGSCCDNARFDFPDCGNWWYYCQKWGIINHTVWLQYSPDGFTMPLSTEHQGICSYSPNQRLCELPKSRCDGKIKNRYNTSLLCGEVEFSLKRQNSYTYARDIMSSIDKD